MLCWDTTQYNKGKTYQIKNYKIGKRGKGDKLMHMINNLHMASWQFI